METPKPFTSLEGQSGAQTILWFTKGKYAKPLDFTKVTKPTKGPPAPIQLRFSKLSKTVTVNRKQSPRCFNYPDCPFAAEYELVDPDNPAQPYAFCPFFPTETNAPFGLAKTVFQAEKTREVRA
jgi:hypothetical protein